MPTEFVPPAGAPLPVLTRARAAAFAACVAVCVAAAALAPAVTSPLAAQRSGAASRKQSAKQSSKSTSSAKKSAASTKPAAKRSAGRPATRTATSARSAAVPPPAARPDSALRAFQVDTVAEPIPETLAPRYPRELRARELRGSVVAEFVVDTAGRVEPGTFRVISSDDPAFSTSVRELLPRARFLPAINEGHLVRQTVRQTFVFDLDVLQRPRTAGAP